MEKLEKLKDKATGLFHRAKKPEIEKNLDNKTSIRLISPEKGQELISQGSLAAADADYIPDKFVGDDKSNDDKGNQDRGLNPAQKLF